MSACLPLAATMSACHIGYCSGTSLVTISQGLPAEDLVAHGGTTADIAARTYRHRNTVRKRLQDFTTLTGFDVSDTTDLATTAIAFTVERARSNDLSSRAQPTGSRSESR